MDDNCGESVESMGVVVRRYIDFLILLIPTLNCICSFLFIFFNLLCYSFLMLFVLVPVLFCNYILCIK